jgi:hypothetical protein
LFTETWITNGSGSTFNLTYKPLFSDATQTGRNWITRNGLNIAVTSVNTSTGLVTLTSAGSSGDIVNVTYPTNFVPAA